MWISPRSLTTQRYYWALHRCKLPLLIAFHFRFTAAGLPFFDWIPGKRRCFTFHCLTLIWLEFLQAESLPATTVVFSVDLFAFVLQPQAITSGQFGYSGWRTSDTITYYFGDQRWHDPVDQHGRAFSTTHGLQCRDYCAAQLQSWRQDGHRHHPRRHGMGARCPFHHHRPHPPTTPDVVSCNYFTGSSTPRLKYTQHALRCNSTVCLNLPRHVSTTARNIKPSHRTNPNRQPAQTNLTWSASTFGVRPRHGRSRTSCRTQLLHSCTTTPPGWHCR